MWTTYLVVISILCVFAAVSLLIRSTRKPSPPKPPKPEGKKWQTYGHPKAPIPTLYEQLPSPPPNHVWEITIGECDDDWNHDGNKSCPASTPALKLGIMNVLTSEVVDSKCQCLVMENHILEYTYVRSYKRYSSIKDNTFQKELIDPLIEWAEQVKRPLMTYDTSDEYMIKGL